MHQPSGVVEPMSFGLLAGLRSTSASHARAKSGVRSAILLYAYEKRSSEPIKQFRPSVCEWAGGSTDRPDLQRLLDDIRARKIDVIVVYKVDRLTRSLADFAKLVELFDAHGVSFVSVTQQ